MFLKAKSNALKKIISAILLISTAYILFSFSFNFQTVFTLNLSPVPNQYVKDFIEGLQQEEKELTYYNWMVDRSKLALPIKTRGCSATFEMRAKRALSRQGYLYVFVNGNRVFMKNILGGQYEITKFRIPREYIDGQDIAIQFRTYSDEANHRRGMRVDWIRVTIDKQGEGKIIPSGEQIIEFFLALILLGIFIYILPIGFWWKISSSGLVMMIFICANTFYRIETSLLIYHVNRWVLLPSIVIVGIFKILQKIKFGSKAPANSLLNDSIIAPAGSIFFISQLVRVIGTFYYQYFYPDLRTYTQYMSVLDSEGIVGFAYWYGHHHLKILYGFATAFPYSPLYHITIYPLTKLNFDYYIWLRVTTTVFNTLFVLLIYFFIIKFLKDKKAAIFGALFAAFSSVMFKRIFLSMYSALFSGLLTFIVIFFLFFYLKKVDDWKYRWLGIIFISLALLSYPSALVNLILMFVILIILLMNPGFKEKDDHLKRIAPNPDSETRRLLLLFFVSAMIAFFIYYIYFVEPMVTELIPFLANNSDKIVWNKDIQIGFFEYLAQRMAFYISIPGMILVFPGLWILFKQKMEKYRRKFLYSWIGAWFILYILSAPQLLSFMLRLGKEELFILPLFATAAGAASAFFWKKGKIFKIAIIAIFAIFIGLSLYNWASNIKSFMVFIE